MGSWRQLAPLPAQRNIAAACWHAGKVYVAGGITDNGAYGYSYQNTLFIYDPAGNTWTTGAPLPGTGLCYAFSTAADGLHVVLLPSGAHYSYDPDTNTWATRTTAPTDNRIRAYTFVDSSGRFYLAAGQRDGSPTYSRKVVRYLPDTDSWTSLADVPVDLPYPLASPGFLGSDNKIYMGYDGFTRDLIVYDPATNTWARTPAAPDTQAVAYGTARLPSGVILGLPHRYIAGLSGSAMRRRVDSYNPASNTWAMGAIPDFPASSYLHSVAIEPGGVVYLIGGLVGDPSFATSEVYAYKQNEPPLVATLLTVTGGVLVSTASVNRARHQFNDPNAGDSQGKFDHRYRKVGATTWITDTVVSPNPWYDFPAGTLTPGDYERQVLTYDAIGEASPAWTPSGLFTAADPPPGPTITYPINGQTLDQVERVDWSTPSQEAYQVRRVADDGAGSPDTATVYYDSGEITDTLARTLPLAFTVNDRTEHVQVRVKDGGLWSDWVSVSGDVSYTRPPTPTFTPYPDPTDASLLIMITNPDPEPGDPAAAYNDVYVTDPDPNTGQVTERRVATQVPTNSGWRYRTPVGSWDYDGARIRVVAVAANGTTASST